MKLPPLFGAANHREYPAKNFPFYNPRFFVAGFFFILFSSVAIADEITPDIVSSIVSYRYVEDFSNAALTNGSISSPIVSYRYAEYFDNAAVINGSINSPIVSYQFVEWPGNSILNLQSSPVVSYLYLFGDGGFGVSSSFSQVEVLPSSLPADGQSTATVTVTLLDGNGNPVSGKTVWVSVVEQTSSSGVLTLSTVTQPANPTDVNGQATATFKSAMSGTAIISVQDVTDGITLARQPNVQFGSALVAPGQGLANAIVQLANSSSNLLTHSIAGIAKDEGGYGDYFQTQLTADRRAQGVNALATGVGGLLDLLVPGSKSLLREVATGLARDFASDGLSEILTVIAGSSTGLTQVGQMIDGKNASLQQAELQSMQNIDWRAARQRELRDRLPERPGS